jgi:hypothetical protein
MASTVLTFNTSGFMGPVQKPARAGSSKPVHRDVNPAVGGVAISTAASLSPATLGELRLEAFSHPPTVNLGSCGIGSMTVGLVKAVNPGPKPLTLSVEGLQQQSSAWSITLLPAADATGLHPPEDGSAAVGAGSVIVPEGGFALIRISWTPEKEARVRQNFWFRINGKSRTNIFVLASAVSTSGKSGSTSVPSASAAAAGRGLSAPSRPTTMAVSCD